MKKKYIIKDKSEFDSIKNALKHEQSLTEYLKENTMPISGTWDDWIDRWFNDWLKDTTNNVLTGDDFYNWLMINYK